MVDYHTHTKLCKHAKGEIEDYVKKAIEKNLTEIGISDHMPLPYKFDPEHRMELNEFKIYKDWFESAVEKFGGKIKLRFGIEAEFIEDEIDFVKDFIKRGDFDYVIGSVHFLNDWVENLGEPYGTDYILEYWNIASHKEEWRWNGKDVDVVYENYYHTMKELVKSGLFDIVGHFDLIKKFGHRANKNFDELISEILKLIKKNDLCIEINTSGLRQKINEIYPSEKILKMIHDYKIPLTLGSDAHTPDDVGRDFDIALALIERYGDGKISIFEKRRRSEIKISY
ncbi:histidinol-phosphatase HisJ [Candidatus Chrysopegis kryptomonas]|uniref:Histidinol-phosphatase n=1 Tax=Candidatus Chryseopegocella kryptomonas TaxID=1633643 RepID=A0A0P1NZA8_9BACT|nr:histidinol-phosphatase HisJ [Candidatus Chrysopegis kryptomonas]CUT04367.1 histidinol-phosphatase (PHP family) [Candidatus Chrysopegis kryptomonas]